MCLNVPTSPSNFFKLARAIFGAIIFQAFVAPSLQNDTFDNSSGKWKKLLVSTMRLFFYALSLLEDLALFTY